MQPSMTACRQSGSVPLMSQRSRPKTPPPGRPGRRFHVPLRRHAVEIWHRFSGPAIGVLCVMVLFLGLFALDFVFGIDLRVFGVYDADTERYALSRYGQAILWHQAKILGVYLSMGLLVGSLAQLLIGAWQASGAWRQTGTLSSQTPLHLPPTPWSLARRITLSVVFGGLLHGGLLLRAMWLRPVLFGETLAEQGGWRLRAMIAITHGPVWPIASVIGGMLGLFVVVGPLLSPRGQAWVLRLVRPRAVQGAIVIACVCVVIGTAWQTLRPQGIAPTPARKTPAMGKPPSVLLIAIDSLRADRIGGAARAITPTLSALADRAVTFDRAFVTVPRTFPSLITLLSGRYPHGHGIRTMFPSPAERAAIPPALPQLLRRRGYETAVVSDFCGEIFSRVDLGFAHSLVPTFDARTIVLQRSLTVHKGLLAYLSQVSPPGVLGTLRQRLFPELDSLADLSDPAALSAQALALLQQAKERGQPTLTMVFFSSAHFPYAAKRPAYQRFAEPGYRGPFLYHKPPLTEPKTPADQQQVRALYDGALSAADAGVAQLLGGLRALGLERETIVVVLADHGENLYDQPGRGMGHGDHLEGDAALRVPLLVLDPVHGFSAHHVPGVVRDIDVLPTVLSLVGADPKAVGDPALDGVDLRPLLDGTRSTLGLSAFHETELWLTESGPGFAEDSRLPYPTVTVTTAVDAQDDIALGDRYRALVTAAKHRALRTERYKLIYRPTRAGALFSLYDVENDPQERHDLAASQPQILAPLKEELFRRIAADKKASMQGDFVVPAS